MYIFCLFHRHVMHNAHSHCTLCLVRVSTNQPIYCMNKRSLCESAKYKCVLFSFFFPSKNYFFLFFMPHAIVGCSHQRAWEYFIESIDRPHAFLATHCESSAQPNFSNISCDKTVTAYMGLHADKRYSYFN